jgi:hypothetical protein
MGAADSIIIQKKFSMPGKYSGLFFMKRKNVENFFSE